MNENPNQNNPQIQNDMSAPVPETPPVISPSPAPSDSPGSKNKVVWLLAVILLIAGATACYLMLNKKPESPTSTYKTAVKLALPNQPKQLNDQFGTQNFTAGYANYKPEKFKKIDFAIPEINPIPTPAAGTQSEQQVVFMNDITYNGVGNGHRLIMYDVKSKTTFLVAQNNSGGYYANAKIMSNHYVVFADSVEIDPLNSNILIKSVDLNTGQAQTIMTDKASNLPVSLCCSVSKDGLRMVIPETNKFLIYQAGESKPITFPAAVQVFPKVAGSGGGEYEASQRNYGYPSVTWLDDNRFMYAKSHPLKWTVDSQGSHAATNNNGLAIYDLTTRQSTDVQRTGDMPINWFNVSGNTLTISTYKPNVGGVVDSNSGLTILQVDDYTSADSIPSERLGIPLDYQSFLYYDQGANKLYVQPTDSGLNEDTTMLNVLDTASGVPSKKKIISGDLKGFIGKDQAVIDTSTYGNTTYSLYDMQTGATQIIFSNVTGSQ